MVLLVAAWGLVLGPALLQSVGNSPVDSERVFRRSLSALGGPKRPRRQPVLGGRSILVPPKSPYPLSGPVQQFGPQRRRKVRSSAALRRRRNLTNLAIFIIVTFVLGIFPPLRFMLVVNLVADVALILYLGLAMYLAIWPSVDREPQPFHGPEPQGAVTADGSF